MVHAGGVAATVQLLVGGAHLSAALPAVRALSAMVASSEEAAAAAVAAALMPALVALLVESQDPAVLEATLLVRLGLGGERRFRP